MISDKSKIVLVTVTLVACVVIALCANTGEDEKTGPVSGASAEGLWHQTETKGYYDGAKITTTFASNDLTIREYTEYTADPKHYLICSQRGYEFLAFRAGDRIMWSYEAENGSFLSISTCYGECIVVNEIFISKSSTLQTYISSSVYTKNNIVPTWLDWDYQIPHQKWVLHDGGAVSDTTTAELRGKSLYMLENSGPIFKGEMEQSVGTAISTKSLAGVIIDFDKTTGYLLALVLDDTDIMWSLTYNGSTITMSAVDTSDTASIEGLISAQRNYTQVYDASLPKIEKPVFTSGMDLELIDTTVFTKAGVSKLGATGTVSFERTYGTAFYTPGHFIGVYGKYDVKMYGFSMHTQAPAEYFVYCVFQGLVDGKVPMTGGGFGSYNSETGIMVFAIMTESNGTPAIVEFIYRNTSIR
ncbi:MAG: hypothetical protein IKQ67_01375 [Candidatus Methanomethylophilaceae archaeon]|nr:hypothetical protein [Candidatus Methanomethylophilaceae archaeon]